MESSHNGMETGLELISVLIPEFSSVPVTAVPTRAPQASLSIAINLFGEKCHPAKAALHLPQPRWVPFLAGMSSEEDNVKSRCFSLRLLGGGASPDCSRLRGTILAATPAEFHFHFFIEKSKSGELEPFHIDSSGASENYILCRTKKVPRRAVTELTLE